VREKNQQDYRNRREFFFLLFLLLHFSALCNLILFFHVLVGVDVWEYYISKREEMSENVVLFVSDNQEFG